MNPNGRAIVRKKTSQMRYGKNKRLEFYKVENVQLSLNMMAMVINMTNLRYANQK